jgi:hypothetical protein
MRHQRAGVIGVVLAAVAASVVAAAGPANADLVTSCTGTAAGVTIPGDLVVPGGQSCELTDVTVTGSTTVRADANLILTTSTLSGTLVVQSNGFADLTSTAVGGATRLNNAFGLYAQGGTVAGTVTVTGSGFSYGTGTSYGANITSTGGETYLRSARVSRNVSTSGDLLTDVYDSVVGGAVTVAGARLGSVLCTSEIDGDVAVSGAADGGVVQLGAAVPVAGCGYVVFGGALSLTGNHAPAVLSDSVVRGALSCVDNDAAPTGAGNRLRAGATGQCADLAAVPDPTVPTGPPATPGTSTSSAGKSTAAADTSDRGAAVLAARAARRSSGERAAIASSHALTR